MVRMVHTSNFYDIYLQISDPNIKFSTKTDIFEKWPCPTFLEMHFWAKKKTCGASTAKQRFWTYSGIFPSRLEPDLIDKSFENWLKPETRPKTAIYPCNIPVGGPKTAMISSSSPAISLVSWAASAWAGLRNLMVAQEGIHCNKARMGDRSNL